MGVTILIDSREKTHIIDFITTYFDMNNIKYYTNKLLVGDYCCLTNPTVIVDRKQSLIEVQGNITQDHERFRAELIKAQESGIQLIVLIQENNIKTLDDVKTKYVNPRMKEWARAKSKALKKGEVFKQRPPLSGEHIYSILKTMQEKYGVIFMFARKENMAETILKLITSTKEEIINGNWNKNR